MIFIYAELFVNGIVAGTLPTRGLYTVGVAVNFLLRDGQQGHAFCEDAVLGRHALVEGQVGGIVHVVDVVAVYVAAFASLSEYVGQQQSRWRYIPSIAPTSGRFGSPFGPRIHPVTGEIGRMHQGVDISNERWTPIFATADGVVEQAKNSPSFGNYVAINHGNNLKTRYGHMQMLLVKPGQLVRRYQIIGYMGSTGMSTGTHLHYEVWVGDRPVNPVAYLLPGDYSVD